MKFNPRQAGERILQELGVPDELIQRTNRGVLILNPNSVPMLHLRTWVELDGTPVVEDGKIATATVKFKITPIDEDDEAPT